MIIRKAGLNDIDTLIEMRIGYLTADHGLTPDTQKLIYPQLLDYFTKHIGGGFIAALAEIDGNTVSTAYLVISEMPANPYFVNGIIGTMLNVFTLPDFRRRGIATQVIRFLIEEAKLHRVSRIDLSASPEGRPLYRSLGFTEPDLQTGYTKMSLRQL
jgi:ribosomal protein S18 acetylase RimI-like enzyme